MEHTLKLLCLIFVSSCIHPTASLLCYQCVSTHPGCGTPFQWIWYKTISCPEDDDVCVKVIERKDYEEVITRDCLSSIKGFRTDIPADHYEGCRANTVDVHLGNYVNNTIKEIDIKRNYYDNVTFCFCYFDHWCNDGSHIELSKSTLAAALIAVLWKSFNS